MEESRKRSPPKVTTPKISHELFCTVPPKRTLEPIPKNTPSNAASSDRMETDPPPVDEIFKTDKYLNAVQMEVLWLGEESMICLNATEFQFDFIWEYATAALKVRLRDLDQDSTAEVKLKQILCGAKVEDEWLVTERSKLVRQEIRNALNRGFRRQAMTLVIAQHRLGGDWKRRQQLPPSSSASATPAFR